MSQTNFLIKKRILDGKSGRFENIMYDIGFYDPKGVWIMVDSFCEIKEAKEDVHYLNGGNRGFFS